jgi:PTH2 family peptidyl-tRNA hydrolase
VQKREYFGQAKIAVKVDSESALLLIEEVARAMGLVTYLVCDAGRTQIAAGANYY